MTKRLIFAVTAATAFIGFGLRAEPTPASVAAWNREDAVALILAAERVSTEGLEPGDYSGADLKAALEADDGIRISIAASSLFTEIAADLIEGRFRAADRRNWFISGAVAEEPAIALAMDRARRDDIEETLRSLAPKHAQYAALRGALAGVPSQDVDTRARLRLNMERWRWMPRDLGPEYILINVPAFELAVVRDGITIDRRRIIAGSVKTPTPQFATTASGLIFNPIWHVPESIAEDGIAALLASDPAEAERLGYYQAPDGGIRQAPGEKNALGRVKLDMPNGYSIFVHDTPAKNLFDRDSRALSHGCIRVESALSFAQALLPQWDEDAINELVSAGATVTAPLERPLPIYVVYFTAVAEADGSISFFPDIYGLDRGLLPKFGVFVQAVASAQPINECPAG